METYGVGNWTLVMWTFRKGVVVAELGCCGKTPGCVATTAMAMSGAAGKAPPGYRYNLVMATVVQNEAPFLPEWLE